MQSALYTDQWEELRALCEHLCQITSEATNFRHNNGRLQITMGFPTVVRHPHRLVIRWAYDPYQSNIHVIRGMVIKVLDAAMEYKERLEKCGIHLMDVAHIWANGPVFELGLLIPEVFDEIKGLAIGEWWSCERLCKALS